MGFKRKFIKYVKGFGAVASIYACSIVRLKFNSFNPFYFLLYYPLKW